MYCTLNKYNNAQLTTTCKALASTSYTIEYCSMHKQRQDDTCCLSVISAVFKGAAAKRMLEMIVGV